jgi:hypothetical protein
MRRFLKGCGLLLGGFVALIVLLLIASQLAAEARLRRTYDVEAATIVIPSDAASIERGRQLVTAGRCRDCHGQSLAGKVSLDEPGIGRIYASNLTSGQGGVGQTYSDTDWVRAIRHGVAPDGRSLVVTPAQFYYYLSDDDLGVSQEPARNRSRGAAAVCWAAWPPVPHALQSPGLAARREN